MQVMKYYTNHWLTTMKPNQPLNDFIIFHNKNTDMARTIGRPPGPTAWYYYFQEEDEQVPRVQTSVRQVRGVSSPKKLGLQPWWAIQL